MELKVHQNLKGCHSQKMKLENDLGMCDKHKCLGMHKRYKLSSFDTTHLHFTQDSSCTTHKIHPTFQKLRFGRTHKTHTIVRICKQVGSN
jgi:hypothetical protein